MATFPGTLKSFPRANVKKGERSQAGAMTPSKVEIGSVANVEQGESRKTLAVVPSIGKVSNTIRIHIRITTVRRLIANGSYTIYSNGPTLLF